MKIQPTTLAATLQSLLTKTIFILAWQCGFFQRTRTYTLDAFVQTLVFGWLENPDTPLETFAAQLGVAPQSLAERLDDTAVAFTRELLQAHLNLLFAADPRQQRLLDRFTEVVVEDSTTVQLPADAADDWPGCGHRDSKTGRAAVKINLRYEVKSGRLDSLTVHAGKAADNPLAATTKDLLPGSLHLADLGYFDAGRWAQLKDSYFISRAHAQVQLLRQGDGQRLADFLAEQDADCDRIDCPVFITKTHALGVRLVALRCPEEVANRRKQKVRKTMARKGRGVSMAQLVLCEWTVLITNVPPEMLSIEEVWVMYRLRWQAEVFFCTLKSGCRIERRRFEHVDRVQSCLAICLIVTWRALFVCHMGRECPDVDCELIFEPSEWKSVWVAIYGTEPPKTVPPLSILVHLIAGLGGHIERPDSEPGTQTLWIGMQRMYDLAWAWESFGPQARGGGR